MYKLKYLSAVPALAIFLSLSGGRSQASTLDDLAQMGEAAMRAGNYARAIEHYEKIVETSPTYEALLAVKFDLAWCYYLTKQPEKAIPLFEYLSSERSPSEAVKQQSLFLLAECHARSAAGKPEGSDERARATSTAVELHTRFQREYKDNPNIPQSLYGRGYAHFLAGKMSEAETDLRRVITLDAGTQTARDARFLLASVYSTRGLEKLKAGDSVASDRLIEQARKVFAELARLEGVNLGMANDSIFSLAETWFAAGEYLQAIRYYQQLRSRKEVVDSLETIRERLRRRRMEELRQEQDTSTTMAAIERLRIQIRETDDEPDRMISGYFRIADAFFRLERYDETRTVSRHLARFTDGEQRQQASYMIINAYLSENDAGSAARQFAIFRDWFGDGIDMVDTVALSIGRIYLADGDLEQAIRFLGESVEEFPEGRNVQEAMYLKFAAEYMDARHEEALATIAGYLDGFPEGTYVANALYYRAMSQAALQRWDAALASINAVLGRFPDGTEEFTSVDEAFYQKGWILNEMEKHADAAGHIDEFLDRFADSALRPEALYQLGIALNADGDMERAESVLQSVPRKFPDHRVAPIALYQVAVLYYEKDDLPGMESALNALIEAYPENPIIVEGYFWLGWIAMQEERYDDAIARLRRSIELDPAHALAPESMLMIARSYQGMARGMGLPTVLGEEQRALYRATVLKAAEAFETLVARHPGSGQAMNSVPAIAESIHDLMRYRQMDAEEAAAYFTRAIARHPDDPNTRAALCFSMGLFHMKAGEREKALGAFRRALSIHPGVKLSPVMLTEYAEALIHAGVLGEAERIYAGIIDDYPDDPLVLAPAWYGLAEIKYREEEFEEAARLFEKVLSEFEWYGPGRQGRVMLAKILEQQGLYEQAEKMFEEVWRQETGVTRLGAMLGVSRCQLAQAEAAKREGRERVWRENIRVADENLTRIIVMFEAYPESVAEALWLKGNAYELVGDSLKARETYSRLVLEEEYGDMPWTAQARERLRQIGGILAPSSS